MTQRYTAQISLTVLGPFLSAATGASSYGVDRSFHRDHRGNLVVPASHIKGKLRMALESLAPYFPADQDVRIDEWFGVASEEASGHYTPAGGMLRFTDLICNAPSELATRTRVAIDGTSGTARENQLFEVESPFPSGSTIVCTGTVSFFADTDQAAEALVRVLGTGLRWLPNLGASKGVGFGRLVAIHVDKPELEGASASTSQVDNTVSALHMRIRAEEPIHLGGVKSGRTNFARSRSVMAGGLIKGALCEALNRAHGIEPPHRPLSAANAHEYPGYSDLVEQFEHIRITHALPVVCGAPRPVRIPLSTVQPDAPRIDLALSKDRYPLVNGQAPTYAPDWKQMHLYFGAASPKEMFVTRTAIDDITERASEAQLFTYSFLCPEDDQGRQVEWVCEVHLSAIGDDALRTRVMLQFYDAVAKHFRYLGKLRRRIQAGVGLGPVAYCEKSRPPVTDDLAVIALQSDTVMLDPARVRELSATDDLHQLYTEYWTEISDGALVLEDYFAQQGFEGGYLYHRFIGGAERASAPFQYRPYYLTLAGSVFRLRVEDASAAQCKLATWQVQGLPFPAWAEAEYDRYDRPRWQNCPFVTENGYGEIAVNLELHWNSRAG